GGVVQVVATSKPGADLARIEAIVDEELAGAGRAVELERAKNVREASFLAGLAGLSARAELLLRSAIRPGDADYLPKDLARYRAVTVADVQRVAAKYLGPTNRVVLTVGPRSRRAP